MKSEKETTESDNDEDEALQENPGIGEQQFWCTVSADGLIDLMIQAIAMSLREMNSQGVAHVMNDTFACESKGDVIERLRNAFAARNRGEQQL
ncbi:unnamed protein product [Toxocara canis]|uniref:DUF3077 domain-containing protein n=1 Tax=Toxocara canis TaxID=6265 RepID=A0A183U8G6_TOXCA|nr:unnamed protein product [Toxocara canis]